MARRFFRNVRALNSILFEPVKRAPSNAISPNSAARKAGRPGFFRLVLMIHVKHRLSLCDTEGLLHARVNLHPP